MKPGPIPSDARRVSDLPPPPKYPLDMGYLPDKFIKKAEDELNETPETREAGLRQIRQMIEEEKNMYNSWMKDDFLLMYLRGRKFNVQKAFNSLKKFVNFVRKHKPYFAPVTKEAFDTFVREKTFTFIPYRDKDGCTILVIYLNKWIPSEVHVDDVVRYVLLFLSHSLSEPMTQVNGFKILFDFKVSPWKYIRYCTPFYAYLMYHATQECIPARFKAIHVLNPSLIFRTFWPFIAPFLPEKLKKRIIIHENGPRMQNFLPDNLIPEYFGGKMKDYDATEWASKVKLPEVVQYIVNHSEE